MSTHLDDDPPEVDLSSLNDAPTPPGLERGVVDGLRFRGAFRPPRRIPLAAAAAAVFLAGVGVGVWGVPSGSPGLGDDASSAEPLWAVTLLSGPEYREPPAGQEASRVAEYAAWANQLDRQGRLVLAEELGEPVARLPASSGFAPAAPVGLFLIRAASAAEASRVAEGAPHLVYGGGIAVQPVVPH